MDQTPPSPCFVSHAYDDGASLAALEAAAAPLGVALRPFPFREPDPALPVSDGIVEAILAAAAVIVIAGGRSSRSFWVRFEADYARRAGKPVFVFDPARGTLRRDTGRPMALDIEVHYNRRDEARVAELFDFMARKRFFDLRESRGRGLSGGVKGDDLQALTETLAYGGAVLWLISPMSAALVLGFHHSLDEVWWEDDWAVRRFRELRDPAGLRGRGGLDPHDYVHSVFASLDRGPDPNWSAVLPSPVIDLREAVEEGFNWNRIDDLIIRLYAALLQAEGDRIASEAALEAAEAGRED